MELGWEPVRLTPRWLFGRTIGLLGFWAIALLSLLLLVGDATVLKPLGLAAPTRCIWLLVYIVIGLLLTGQLVRGAPKNEKNASLSLGHQDHLLRVFLGCQC